MADFELFSDSGSRPVNEDYVITEQKNGSRIFIVADGLGGHGKGDEASRFAAREFVRCFLASENFINDMGAAFSYVQQELLKKQEESFAKYQMKTTLVVLLVTKDKIRWGFIGDSRLYMLKNSKIEERTLDHSVPQRLAISGDISENEIRFHPDRNKLLRVMGSEWGASSYELSQIKGRTPNTSFLLCTDGFWELVDDIQIEQTHRQTKNSLGWVLEMYRIIKKNGEGKNMDNLSAIAIRL